MNKQKPAQLPKQYAEVTRSLIVQKLQRWYDLPSGRYALITLHEIIQRMSADVFGYYALQTGWLTKDCHFLSESRISHNICMPAHQGLKKAHCVADPDALPIMFDTVDLVVSFHSLEYAYSPHQVLREIDRVLVPEGHCIVVAFNPFSLRGLGLAWRQIRRSVQASQPVPVPAIYTASRIKDWFDVLGFEHIETCYISLNSQPWLQRFGALQVIHVRKKVARQVRIKPRLRARSLLQPDVVINPSTSRWGHTKERG